jgi:hypothetical protein
MKKSYASPTVVRYGSAVVATLGNSVKYLEFINWRPAPI